MEETKKKAILPWNILQILKMAKSHVLEFLNRLKKSFFFFNKGMEIYWKK